MICIDAITGDIFFVALGVKVVTNYIAWRGLWTLSARKRGVLIDVKTS